MEDLKKKKGTEPSASGINVIEINIALSSSNDWVFDTGSMIHTCKSLQGLSDARRFAKGELDVHVGNGAKVVVLAVGTYHLSLPLGLVNKHCSIYYNNIFYAHCPLVNGLYALDLEDKYICNINTKRLGLNDLNPTFIWHYRLGHINEKRIEQLHKDGLLSSFDFKSFDTCESCLLGKMTKVPLAGQSDRATDLLGLVQTDVCGPMSSTARGNFQYFISFTDDFSRYGYVYLMRNISESFEKFKKI